MDKGEGMGGLLTNLTSKQARLVREGGLIEKGILIELLQHICSGVV